MCDGEDAQRPIHHHHHILTKLMPQKQYLSLIHLIYAIALPWLRQVQLHPSKDDHLFILWVPKMHGFITATSKHHSWQLSGICWLPPRFSIQTVFPAPNSNRWRVTKWGTLQLPGLTATPPASPTQRRAAGRNQEGQNTLLMLMRAPTIYTGNRTEHLKHLNSSFFLYYKGR